SRNQPCESPERRIRTSTCPWITFCHPSFENEKERSQNGDRKANANASAVAASQDNGQDDVITEPSGEAETAVTEGGVMAKQVIPEGEVEGNDPLTREDVIVDRFDAAAKRMDSLEQRVSDLEDVSVGNAPRWTNIRIIGLEEGTEGRDPAAFFEEWIPAILEMRVKRVKIDKAIRMGLQTGRIHDYADKQRILYAARDKGRVEVDGKVISFYQDFSAEVVKKRQESASARRRLREAGVKYAFLYPAVIKIIHPNGKFTSLSNMREVDDFMKTLPE
ncbi:hypothetical protein WMY93_032082, partial [Mugilogobius chulae]